MLDFLKQQGIDDTLIARIQQFRKDFPVAEGDALRIPSPRFRYYGREIWQLAITSRAARCFAGVTPAQQLASTVT